MAEVPGEHIRDAAVDVLKSIYDPEIPVDIWELGLIYEIKIANDPDSGGKAVFVLMTLTSPNCPVAETLPMEVKTKLESIQGVSRVELKLVWDPPWSKDMMSDVAKLELGFM